MNTAHTATAAAPHSATAPRAIVHRTRGRSHGPITRLASPGDLGHHLKPFVFLDLFSTKGMIHKPNFGMHPHSGIATLTYLIEGAVSYEDSTGEQGILPEGSVEWMQAGNGVWHTGAAAGDAPMLGFQLWVALPPALENAAPHSMYIEPARIAQHGPARVLLGSYGGVHSPIQAPSDMTYVAVRLRDGEHFRYDTPPGHNVAWLALNAGQLDGGVQAAAGELVVFEESEQALDMVARGETSFVIGSAVKHPHELVMGNYSVHTSRAALVKGEAEIERIGARLQAEGRLR